jgi:hypothetical protein
MPAGANAAGAERLSDSVGWYAYGVVPARAELALDGLVGVDPQFGVDVMRSGDVAAVASRVRLSQFGAAALEQNLEDRAWLERTARAHDAVVTRALDAEAVVPLRLCTIFSSDERLLAMLREHEASLRSELRRMWGRAEWAVKILTDPASAEAAGPAAGAGAAASGRDYLARKRHQRSAREDAQAQIDVAVGEAHARLLRHADAAAVLRSQNADLSGRHGRMVHNGAYLVDTRRVGDFTTAVDDLAEELRPQGLHVELAGPWAPYNFVTTGGFEP